VEGQVIAFMLVAFIWFPWMMLTMVPFRSATQEMLACPEEFNAQEQGLRGRREKVGGGRLSHI